MLVLSRRPHESIRLTIPENLPPGTVIEITTLEVRANAVRIGLTAPRSVQIARSELVDESGVTSKEAPDE
ncbi:carbon storage regulator (plasmid) [Planctopirus limnophila DSM 3776]|uniref:Translational regulator CsrA n=1 Tax=Planctopirus limnophila (strain ATCC 43296 / DSM 3776 / IFAM 1008 / Mu 290) TaxID=521674 RepID=D5SZG9_PLAL2|nr:carbon storage regulator [Planctopirus limnophila]ADG70089.1 carbon storage regulator [Planctopirus limnophila DSM 3776]